jgi:hypothetical protein
MSKITLTNLIHAGSFGVDSGQAMVGDPCYLDNWDTNKNEDFSIEGKEGQYSYLGASATTLANSYGELGNATAVVFNTGYGDGIYPVYVQMNEDGRVSKVVIDFEGDID